MEKRELHLQPDHPFSIAAYLCLRVMNFYRAIKAAQMECLAPRPLPSHMRIEMRPRGSNLMIHTEVLFEIFRYSEYSGEMVLMDEINKMLTSAERCFGRKNLIITITTSRDEAIASITRKIGGDVNNATQLTPVNPVSSERALDVPAPAEEALAMEESPGGERLQAEELQPPREKTPLIADEENPAPSTPQVNPLNTDHQDPAQPIDYGSMKYYSTETTPHIIRKAFEAIGISTGQDVLDRLGTTNPTRKEWQTFISRIQKEANAKGLSFGSGSEGTLYYWLVKKTGWIEPLTA